MEKVYCSREVRFGSIDPPSAGTVGAQKRNGAEHHKIDLNAK